MSQFSGKCDMFDHLSMIDTKGEWTEQKAFEEFKKQTNGRIFQHKKIYLTKDNVNFWIKQTKSDRFASLKRDKQKGYVYWSKHFKTLKSLNKQGFYATVEIKLTTLLDFIKYYPYIICFSCGDHVEISSESHVDREIQERQNWKWLSEKEKQDSISFYERMKTDLMDHYLYLKEMKQ